MPAVHLPCFAFWSDKGQVCNALRAMPEGDLAFGKELGLEWEDLKVSFSRYYVCSFLCLRVHYVSQLIARSPRWCGEVVTSVTYLGSLSQSIVHQ